jgi:hypothetical protein
VRTVIVSPVGTDVQNGTALRNAISGLAPSPAPTARWLIHVEPGRFDLGATPLTLPSSVDLEGSGQDMTTITGAVTGDATLAAGDLSEIRQVGVSCTAPNCGAITSLVGTAPSLDHVTAVCTSDSCQAISLGGNSSVTSSTVAASGTNSIAVALSGGQPLLRGVDIGVNVTGGAITDNAVGLFIQDCTPVVQNSTVSADVVNGGVFGVVVFMVSGSTNGPATFDDVIVSARSTNNSGFGLGVRSKVNNQSARFNGSILNGNTKGINEIGDTGTMTVLISDSEVDNGVNTAAGITLDCIGDYNQAFTALNGTCGP